MQAIGRECGGDGLCMQYGCCGHRRGAVQSLRQGRFAVALTAPHFRWRVCVSQSPRRLMHSRGVCGRVITMPQYILARCQGRNWAGRRSCVVCLGAAARHGMAWHGVMRVTGHVPRARRRRPVDSSTDQQQRRHMLCQHRADGPRSPLGTTSTSLPHTRIAGTPGHWDW